MKGANKIILFILLSIVVLACRKEHLQPNGVTGSPVFYFNGNVNSAPVSLQAGANDYYMYSSYTQDLNNVYNYTGSLQQIGCTTCSNSIKITINDYRTTATGGSETNMDSALAISNYTYLSPVGGTTTSYSIKFTSVSDGFGTISTYNWNFGDGQTSTLANPTHTFLHPGAYNTTLSVSYNHGCNSSTNDTVGEGAPHAIVHSSVAYTVYPASDSVNFVATTSGGTPPYTYKWKFGDTGTANSATTTHTYSGPGQYTATLTTTDVNSNSSTTLVHVNPGKDTSNCFVNFTEGPIVNDSNGFSLSNVTIQYTDANGVTYSSADIAQPGNSYFKILSVTGYNNNENNQTTKKLHVQFTCMLKSGSNSVTITNGDAVIAVAYK